MHRIHQVIHRRHRVHALTAHVAAAGEARHLLSDRHLRDVVWRAMGGAGVVVERAPVVRDRLHPAVEGHHQLQQPRAVDLVERARADRRHAAVRRLVVREVAIRIDAQLLAAALLDSNGVGHRHDEHRARVHQPAHPSVGVVPLHQPPGQSEGRRRPNALVAVERTRDEDLRTRRVGCEGGAICHLEHVIEARRELAALVVARASARKPKLGLRCVEAREVWPHGREPHHRGDAKLIRDIAVYHRSR